MMAHYRTFGLVAFSPLRLNMKSYHLDERWAVAVPSKEEVYQPQDQMILHQEYTSPKPQLHSGAAVGVSKVVSLVGSEKKGGWRIERAEMQNDLEAEVAVEASNLAVGSKLADPIQQEDCWRLKEVDLAEEEEQCHVDCSLQVAGAEAEEATSLGFAVAGAEALVYMGPLSPLLDQLKGTSAPVDIPKGFATLALADFEVDTTLAVHLLVDRLC